MLFNYTFTLLLSVISMICFAKRIENLNASTSSPILPTSSLSLPTSSIINPTCPENPTCRPGYVHKPGTCECTSIATCRIKCGEGFEIEPPCKCVPEGQSWLRKINAGL